MAESHNPEPLSRSNVVTDHVAADGSSNVAITADIHDMEGLQALMASPSPEDAAAEERHGVIQPIRSTSRSSPSRQASEIRQSERPVRGRNYLNPWKGLA